MISNRFIYFIKISRILASVLSLSGGYVFIHRYISETIVNITASHAASIVLLTFIEAGSIIMLTTGFIYAYEKRINISIVTLFTAALFLGVSFVLTANGAKEWVDLQTDKTVEIAVNHDKKIEDVRQEYEALINKYQSDYDSIKSLPVHPYYSVRVQRTEMLKDLSERIIFYQQRLEKEEDISITHKEQDVEKNIVEVEETKHIYYITASFIMILVFVFNFLLVFIKYQNSGKISENFSEISDEIDEISFKKSEIFSEESNDEKDDDEIKFHKNFTSDEKNFTEISDEIFIIPDEISFIEDEIEQKVLLLKMKNYKQKKIAEMVKLSESKVTRIIKKYKSLI